MGEEADRLVGQLIDRMTMTTFTRRVRRRRSTAPECTIKVRAERIEEETEKALFAHIKGVGALWIPKSIILVRSKKTLLLQKDKWACIKQSKAELISLLDDIDEED